MNSPSTDRNKFQDRTCFQLTAADKDPLYSTSKKLEAKVRKRA